MSTESSIAEVEPIEEVQVRPKAKKDKKPKRQPRYHVILWNDEDHSFEYVIEMLHSLFGYPQEKGFQLANEVHLRGRAICLTTTKEHAELKRDQIHAFGKDRVIDECRGSMSSTIEAEA